MAREKFKTTAVVLGMHRSGTSAISGLLNICMFSSPKNLIEKNKFNERGFWESKLINEYNDYLLNSFGQNWHSVSQIIPDAFQNSRGEKEKIKIEKIISEEFTKSSNPLIKDPRICRILDYWIPALEGVSERVIYPIMLRNPFEVSASLVKRNNLSPEYGQFLWARYVLDAEAGTRGRKRFFLDFSDLLDDWHPVIARLEAVLDVDLAIDEAKERSIDLFLSGELQHERMDHAATLSELAQNPLLKGCHEILDRWRLGETETSEDHARLDDFRLALDQMGGPLTKAFESARLDRKRLSQEKEKSLAANADLSKAQAALVDLDALRQAAKAQCEDISKLGDEVSKLRMADHTLQIENALNVLTQITQDYGTTLDKIQSDYALQGRGLHDRLAELAETNNRHHALEQQLAAERAARSTDADYFRAQLEQATEISKSERVAREADVRYFQEQSALAAERFEKELQTQRDLAQLQRKQINSLELSLAETAEKRERLIAEKHDLTNAAKSLENDLKAIEKKVEQSSSDAAVLVAELKAVKRKYRSVQSELVREKENNARNQMEIRNLENELQKLKSILPVRFWYAIRALISRVLSARLTGTASTRRKKFARWAETIGGSELFDRDWYLATYPDVSAANVDPLRHFAEIGWQEGRNPGPEFNSSDYLKANQDVAAAGLNPLVHYLEFGHSEGRPTSIGSDRSPLRNQMQNVRAKAIARSPEAVDGFGEPAPVFQAQLNEAKLVHWDRHYRLATKLADVGQELSVVLKVGDIVAGCSSSTENQRDFAWKLSGFERLSGISDLCPPRTERLDVTAVDLIDAWHAGNGIFKIRMRRIDGTGPFVVRGFQRISAETERLDLVGESLIYSPLDAASLVLGNSFFPLFLVFTAPGGEVIGTQTIPFPSLRRGGWHQAESLLQADEAVLAEQLCAVTRGEVTALLRTIELDLRDADGSEQIFRRDLQDWLSVIARIGITPFDANPENSGAPADWLRATANLEPRPGRSGPGQKLRLSARMIPTIAALAAIATSEKSAKSEEWYAASAILDPLDPSIVPQLANMPPISGSLIDPPLFGASIRFPLISGSPESAESISAAAISRPANLLSDAEWLKPIVLVENFHELESEDIAILIEPSQWHEEHLRSAIEALSHQVLVQGMSLQLIGAVSDNCTSLAQQLFPRKCSVHTDIEDALSKTSASIFARIGPNLILHDNNAIAVLANLLRETSVKSVSCPVLSLEQRGKVLAIRQSYGHACNPEHSALLWRSTFPIQEQAGPFWLAKREALAGRRSSDDQMTRDCSTVHLFTSLVSATQLTPNLDTEDQGAITLDGSDYGLKMQELTSC